MSKEIFDIQKLKNSENYSTWCFAIKNVLALKGLEKCIIDQTTESDATKLSNCKAILSLSVDQGLYVHIQSCSTAAEIWSTLKNLFEDKGLTRKISLLRNLIGVRLENCETMQEYVDSIVNYSQKLNGIGFKMTNDWTTAILLAGLTDDFKPFIMGIEGSESDVKFENLVSKLLDSSTEKNDGNVLLARKKFFKKNKSKQRKCYNCGSTTHLANTCDKPKNQSNGNSKKEYAKNAFSAIVCENEETEYAMICKNNSNEWYVDSGASSHMTPFGNVLNSMKATEVMNITSANNAKLQTKGMGKAKLTVNSNEIDINEVLHVPDLVANLLSVSKIVDKGNTVIFDRNGCTIKNDRNEAIANCKPKNGVYKFTNEINETCMLNRQNESALLWHRRLGHVNFETMKKMRDIGVQGIHFSDDNTEIKNCKSCVEGKQHRIPFQRSKRVTENVLELIHSDLIGPMQNSSFGNARYVLTFVDDYSRKVFSYFLSGKDKVFETFIDFKAYVEKQTGSKIKKLRTDNGREYLSNAFEMFLKKNGIQHQLTTPYTPQQNGVAERFNRTIIERAKCMIFDANLSKKFWAEAVHMATYIINKTLSGSTNKIPDELFFKEKIDISNLKIFGSRVMVHIPKEKRRKLDKKADEMIFVGYDSNTKGFRCINKDHKLIISRDVVFYEQNSPNTFKMNMNEVSVIDYRNQNKCKDEFFTVGDDIQVNEEANNDDPDSNDEFYEMNENEHQNAQNETLRPNDNELDETHVQMENDVNETREQTEIIDISNDTFNESLASNGDFDASYHPSGSVNPDSSGATTRSKSKVNPLDNLLSFALFIEPKTVNEALICDEAEKWKSAMEEEMNSHEVNNTWTLVKRPPNTNIVKSKWIFKIKDDGENKRYKARLVAKGFSQVQGVDYCETFSPVVRYTTIRFLIAMSVQLNLHIYQMDAVTAFLQGDLDELIYMEQPEFFHDRSNNVCKLNRSIYGLKQAGRQWNIKLDNALQKFKLNKSKNDPCIYFNNSLTMVIAIYVDDFLIFYKKTDELNELRTYLHTTFRMKDIGDANSCIGIKIEKQANYIELHQCDYVQYILERFGMTECKPIKTPTEINLKLTTENITVENSLVGVVPYQEVVGSLLYLAQATRPDIAFAVNYVSRFNTNHSNEHWKAVKRILRYLKGTMNYRLRYSMNNDKNFVAYSDSDWGSDVTDRKSCTGFAIILSNAAVSWSSKKQPIIALSSTEAEYIAISSTTKEIIWLKQLYDEINTKKAGTINLFCDNQSAVKLTQNDAFRPRTKHIEIRFHHTREKILDKTIKMLEISTHDMIADALTKAVGVKKHEFCAAGMGLISKN